MTRALLRRLDRLEARLGDEGGRNLEVQFEGDPAKPVELNSGWPGSRSKPVLYVRFVDAINGKPVRLGPEPEQELKSHSSPSGAANGKRRPGAGRRPI
jgi:hypothetical protein